MPDRSLLLPMAAVATLAAALYAVTVGYGFVFDDEFLVAGNAFLREPWSVTRAFAHHFWHGTPFGAGYYRPLVTASLALNGRLLGWGPAGFHLVNVLLHAANAALLLLLARRLGAGPRAAWLGAAFFAVHPATAWAVGSVVARVDLLPALFVLLAWLAWPRPALTGGLFLLALLCKESAVAFLAVPLMATLSEPGPAAAGAPSALPRGPLAPRARVLLACAAALGIYLLMRRLAGVPLMIRVEDVDPLTNPLGRLPLDARLPAALALCGRYLAYLFLPVGFRDPADYRPEAMTAAGAPGPAALAGGALLVAWSAAVLILWWRRRGSAALPAFALGAFLPASNLLAPIGSLYALNFLYMPVLGLALIVAGLASRVAPAVPASPTPDTPATRPPRIFYWAAPLLALLGWGAVREVSLWKDGMALFSAWTERFPNYSLGHSRLGVALLGAGDPAGAVPALRRAITLAPDNAEAHYNLGYALTRTSNEKATLEEALEETLAATRLMPELLQARVNAARIALLLDRPTEAEAQAREALRLEPGFPPARLNLAEALFRLDRDAEAAEHYRVLVDFQPADPEIRSPYVVALIRSGDLKAARTAAEAARRDFPTLAWFDFCLARIEARSGNRRAAIDLLRLAQDKGGQVLDWAARVEDFRGLSIGREIGRPRP